ncbi:hypothetical protein [Salipaludibacillus sp. CF4.18]|uniref:hypothetical protein n=1 Tax=Salipaludibacillus sp. CF4.18 TaxID=3373081 RepID=UPI003EE5E7D3
MYILNAIIFFYLVEWTEVVWIEWIGLTDGQIVVGWMILSFATGPILYIANKFIDYKKRKTQRQKHLLPI